MPDQIDPSPAEPTYVTPPSVTPQPPHAQPAPAPAQPESQEPTQYAAAPTQQEGAPTQQEEGSTPPIIDRRPASPAKLKPLARRLVGRDVIEGFLTFVTEHTSPEGERKLERWWLPDATEAMEHLSTEEFMEAAASPVGADIGIAFAALAASSVDEDTAKALIELPLQSTGTVLGQWQQMANSEGTTAGESRSSAPA